MTAGEQLRALVLEEMARVGITVFEVKPQPTQNVDLSHSAQLVWERAAQRLRIEE